MTERTLTVEIGPYYGHWVASLRDGDTVIAFGQDLHKETALRDMWRHAGDYSNHVARAWVREVSA